VPNNVFTGTYSQHLEYAITGTITSNTVIDTDTVNNPPAAFNGSGSYSNATTNLTNTNVISAFGLTQSVTQAAKTTVFTTLVGGLQALVGYAVEQTSSGVTIKSSTAYNPFAVSRIFTLAVGQELTDLQSGTTTTTLPTPSTNSFSGTTRYKYVSRQNITVLGKSYDTCKYETQAMTPTPGEIVTDWFVVGKGVMVRQIIGGAAPSTTELKLGTINGAPV
jgi:hypothetical protein